MKSAALRQTLIEMASGREYRSETARLNEVFDDVEKALRAGVSRKAVLEALHRQGFTMTFGTFENAIARLRKRRKTSGGQIQNPLPALSPGKSNDPAREPGEKPGGLVTQVAVRADNAQAPGTVPDDWLTAELTPAQYRLLSPAQKRQKRETEVDRFFPNPRWAGKFPHLWAPQNPPLRDTRSMKLARSGRTLPFTPRMKKRGCWSECLEAASANNHRHARRRGQTSAGDCPDYGR